MCPLPCEPDHSYLHESEQNFDLHWQHRLEARIFKKLDQSVIQLLIQVGANLLAKNQAGLTPLMHALRLGSKNQRNIETIILCSKLEELGEVDSEGSTAFHHLARTEVEKREFLKTVTKVN